MKCHHSPSCMRYWLLTHSDTRRCFQLKTSLSSRTGYRIHCPVRLMTVFIVNRFFVTGESAGTLWLRDVVHLSCSHSHFICPGQTAAMTRSLWPEAPRVLFITIKSARPNVSASSLAGIGSDARLNHHPALRRSPFSHQCVSGRQRREATQCKDGSSTHAASFPATSVITLADPHTRQSGRGRQLLEARCIFHYSAAQHCFSSSFVIN